MVQDIKKGHWRSNPLGTHLGNVFRKALRSKGDRSGPSTLLLFGGMHLRGFTWISMQFTKTFWLSWYQLIPYDMYWYIMCYIIGVYTQVVENIHREIKCHMVSNFVSYLSHSAVDPYPQVSHGIASTPTTRSRMRRWRSALRVASAGWPSRPPTQIPSARPLPEKHPDRNLMKSGEIQRYDASLSSLGMRNLSVKLLIKCWSRCVPIYELWFWMRHSGVGCPMRLWTSYLDLLGTLMSSLWPRFKEGYVPYSYPKIQIDIAW